MIKIAKDIIAFFQRLWNWIDDLWAVVKVCRFSVIVFLCVTYALLFNTQGQELLHTMADWNRGRLLGLIFSTLALATMLWYWPRILLVVLRDLLLQTRGFTIKRIDLFIQWVPRILGFLIIIVIAAALRSASNAFRSIGDYAHFTTMNWIAAGFAAMAIVFLIIVVNRRKWLGIRTLKDFTYTSIASLPRSTKSVLSIVTAAVLFLFIEFTFNGIRFGQMLNTSAIVLLAGSAWVTFGCILVYWADKFRLPLLSMLFIWALIVGYCKDVHFVRPYDPTATPHQTNFRDHVHTWSKQNVKDKHDSIPLVLIAAEGGGIRAAYFTASLLGRIEDIDSNFHKRIFAASGVSGGSLGLCVYCSMLADSGKRSFFARKMSETAGKILGHDFLSPPAGVMLFSETICTLLPFGSIDRSVDLEDSWSNAWYDEDTTRTFNSPFTTLYQDSAPYVPPLILNCTSVEHGNRIIVSSLKIDSTIFHNAIDFYKIVPWDVQVSTAAHMSARFTYVSPAGSIHDRPEHIWGHVVDGGYFDNSGAETLIDILDTLRMDREDFRVKPFKPIVIVISNDSSEQNHSSDEEDHSKGIFEFWAPVETFLNTRDAHARYSKDALEELVKQMRGNYFHFNLDSAKVPIPLGWQLSETAEEEIGRHVKGDSTEINIILECLR